MILYCATSNTHKLREFQHAASELAPGLFTIESLPGISDIPVAPETGDTFEANAIQKALYYSAYTAEAVFADDSGLAVDALNGAPGVHSARYAGVGGDARANNALLLERMRGVDDRSAHFVCVIALAQGNRILGTFRGTVDGHIIDAERGGEGFGYDPLFFYPPFQSTFGEATPLQKLTVSHRGRAFLKLLEHLRESPMIKST